MSPYRFPLLGLFGLSFVLWLTSSCNSDDDGKCVKGETRMCTCVGGIRGVQACVDSSSYGECDCSGNGIAGSSAVDPGPELRILVGRPCRADAECGEGLGCITAESDAFGGLGGVAGGYCTKGCNTATTATDCAGVDPESDCLAFDQAGNGLCFRTCLTQDPVPGEEKCLNRTNVACNSEAALGLNGVDSNRTTGWCLPRCNSDLECPGRVCNAANGICQTAQLSGLPIGAPCTAATDCAGRVCLQADEDERVCAAQCVYQGLTFQPSACGYAQAPRGAACLIPAFSSAIGTEGVGDLGACLEVCDVDADCEQVAIGWFCRPVAGIQVISGRAGYCLPASARDPDADAGAGDGGLDGGAGVDASTPIDAG
jgi:hypothetical protein